MGCEKRHMTYDDDNDDDDTGMWPKNLETEGGGSVVIISMVVTSISWNELDIMAMSMLISTMTAIAW